MGVVAASVGRGAAPKELDAKAIAPVAVTNVRRLSAFPCPSFKVPPWRPRSILSARMHRLISIKLLALVLVGTWSCASNPGETPARGAGDVATRFVAAWNAHDPPAFGALMAADADWVTASGIRLRGRDRIQAYLADEHATWAKPTSMRAMNIQVRALNPKSAVILFEWAIETPAKDGGASSITRGNNLFVAANENGWTIVAGQVARARTQ
jgi:uncharacterized protein (TIGR02246 family)